MGMIIVGYPGIGKSTICGANKGIIDLESSFFGSLPFWDIVYVSVAIDLATQGYDVLVSSHERVINTLAMYDRKGIEVGVIFPDASEEMREKWTQKLRKRYEQSRENKDIPFAVVKKNYRALSRAEQYYQSDIQNLMSMDTGSDFHKYIIHDIDYDLESIIKEIKNVQKENK